MTSYEDNNPNKFSWEEFFGLVVIVAITFLVAYFVFTQVNRQTVLISPVSNTTTTNNSTSSSTIRGVFPIGSPSGTMNSVRNQLN